jgi:hypothetical protein
MYYIQTKKNLGANRGFFITRAYINVCTIYKISIYVSRCCSRIIILCCGVCSSYPMWAVVPCVLVGYGHVEWWESYRPYVHRQPTHTEPPMRGNDKSPDGITRPCERFLPLYTTITNKNAGKNSPHWIRTTHPTTQNYYPTATPTYIYTYFIYCTCISIWSSYKKPHDWHPDSFYPVCSTYIIWRYYMSIEIIICRHCWNHLSVYSS